VFLTQLSSHARISVWRIVWVTTICCFTSDKPINQNYPQITKVPLFKIRVQSNNFKMCLCSNADAKCHNQYSSYATGWRIQNSNPDRAKTFLFSRKRPNLLWGLRQPLIHWGAVFISALQRSQGLELTTHNQLVCRLIMNGATPSLPTCSFTAWRQTSFTFRLTFYLRRPVED
jgi:hypothetical protein